MRGRGASSVSRGWMRRCAVENDCIQPDSIDVLERAVESIRVGRDIQHLSLVVNVPGTGMLLKFKLGPADCLLGQGLELKAGGPVLIRYAVTNRKRTWQVPGIGDGEGPMVTLRADNGEPLWQKRTGLVSQKQ